MCAARSSVPPRSAGLPLSLAVGMPSVTIEGYKGVAPNEGTSVLGSSSVGTLTFWMATLNLLSHYFGGASCPRTPDSPVSRGSLDMP